MVFHLLNFMKAMVDCKFKIVSAVFLTFLFVIAYCNVGTADDLNVDLKERLLISVEEDGTVIIIIDVSLKEPFIDLSRISSVEKIPSMVEISYRGGFINIMVRYEDVRVDDVRLFADEIAEEVSFKLGVERLLFWKTDFSDWIDEITGKWRSFVIFYYNLTFSRILYEELVNRILEVKFDDGFSLIINKRFMENVSAFNIHLYPGQKLFVKKVIPQYFKFKVGGIYVLDVLRLLNVTGGLKTHSKAQQSIIDVSFYSPREWKYVFIDIYIPVPYTVLRHYILNLNVEGIEFTNNPWGRDESLSHIPGKSIDDIKFKFKIVQKEYEVKFEINSLKIIGILMIFLTSILLGFIIYRMKLKRKGMLIKG